MDLSIRRIILLKLREEEKEAEQYIKVANKTLQYVRATMQTVRHCKKEVLDKLLDDPELKAQYDSMVSKLKEASGGNERESEERVVASVSDDKQLPDGPGGEG